MIVKNGGQNLRPCLESVQGIVSQIVIADTGSTDNTVEIARDFGATIMSVPWENHYAKARNAALEPVTTDWVLVLDADEELDRESGKKIPQLLNAADVGGYLTPIRNYVATRFGRGWDRVAVSNDHPHERAKDAPAFIVHENCRFFRRHKDIYFAGRVHELVEHQIKGLGLKIQPANFFIHHFGQLLGKEVRDHKGVYYRDLLRLRVQDNPNDALGWIQLGLQEYEYFKNPEEALRCFEHALTLDPRASEPWLFTAMIHIDSLRYAEALKAVENDHREGQCAALREQVRGDALHGLGRFKDARMAYRKAAKLTPRGDAMLESKIGYTEVKMGQKQTGLARLRRAARAVPGMYAIHDLLMKACMISGRMDEAADVAEKLSEDSGSNFRLFLRAASLCAQLEQWERTEHILERGLAKFPDSRELRDVYAEVKARKPSGVRESLEAAVVPQVTAG